MESAPLPQSAFPHPELPRPEYPRPQFQRHSWMNLNGSWDFREDPGDCGFEAEFLQTDYPDQINVPFCRETPLSGLHREDPVLAVWYRRKLTIPADWHDQRILLHFGAADYETTVWVNGEEVGTHHGGHVSFTFEITQALGENQSDAILDVRCRDDWREAKPKGKQTDQYGPFGCCYPRTTGIWQTVWLEAVPPTYLGRPSLSSINGEAYLITLPVQGLASDLQVQATLGEDPRMTILGDPAKKEGIRFTPLADTPAVSVPARSEREVRLLLPVPEEHRHIWQPGEPHHHAIRLRLLDAHSNVHDEAYTYGGLRSVSLDGNRFLINGQAIFQRLILDQGYYPDGLLTAPSDDALRRDIELSLAAGFNGARLHQKVFEERFLAHADQLGYLVWGELPDWGHDQPGGDRKERHIGPAWIEEWLEAVARDRSHPAIIGWCPLNEQMPNTENQRRELARVQRILALATRLADPTRPILDASGWMHLDPQGELYDGHNYDQNPETFAAKYAQLPTRYINREDTPEELPYDGQPFFVSEFGGAKWIPGRSTDEGTSWGYGNDPRTEEEFLTRFADLCQSLLRNPNVFGYCYTQLTDVFQECNGLYTFTREVKFPPEKLKAAQSIPAAYEAEG